MTVQMEHAGIVVEVSESKAKTLEALYGYKYVGEDAPEPERAPETPKRRPGRPRKES